MVSQKIDSNLIFLCLLEKTKEDAAKAEAAVAGDAAGGLEDDDVWGDVDDVSIFYFGK